MNRSGFPEWQKIKRSARALLQGSEDYLTSRTLGMMRFLEDELLRCLFAKLGIALGAGPFDVTLWPRDDGCEPDVTIESKDAFVLIEAKFLRSRLGDHLPQLGREWLTIAARDQAVRHLLLVTNDQACPLVPSLERRPDGALVSGSSRVTIATQIRQYHQLFDRTPPDEPLLYSAIRWCSWSDLYTICENLLSTAIARADRHALCEIIAAIDRLDCLPYRARTSSLLGLVAPPPTIGLLGWTQVGAAASLWTIQLPRLPATYSSWFEKGRV